jgi:hypothetical protein
MATEATPIRAYLERIAEREWIVTHHPELSQWADELAREIVEIDRQPVGHSRLRQQMAFNARFGYLKRQTKCSPSSDNG